MAKDVSEELIECMDQLLNQLVITRKDQESLYYQILDNEKELRTYFNEYFRFPLVIQPEFVKLEKTRERHFSWMDVDAFRSPSDFVLFYCLLSFLDDKTDRQFVLSELTQALAVLYPGEQLTWVGSVGYQHRLSLIRIVRYAEEVGLLETVDQEVDGFKGSAEHEVLFQGTKFIRYYLRSFAFNLQQATSLSDLEELQAEEDANMELNRSHRVYRRMFAEPVVARDEWAEDEWLYLKHYSYILRDHAEKYTHMRLEQYQDSLLLVYDEAEVKRHQHVYPDASGISRVCVQFAGYLRERVQNGTYPIEEDGTLRMTSFAFRECLEQFTADCGEYWTAHLQRLSLADFREELLRYLRDWKFVMDNEEEVRLTEAFARIAGRFVRASTPKEELA